MKTWTAAHLSIALLAVTGFCAEKPYAVVGTGQTKCYGDRGEVAVPQPGQPFYGQDAQYSMNPPSYQVNGDGTVSDLVTGLMWIQDPGGKKTFDQAVADAAKCRTGNYDDWCLPTIKEL